MILVVLFDKSTTHGLVRLRVKKANQELTKIFDDLAAKAASTPALDPFGGDITDDDIDNLFNDDSDLFG